MQRNAETLFIYLSCCFPAHIGDGPLMISRLWISTFNAICMPHDDQPPEDDTALL